MHRQATDRNFMSIESGERDRNEVTYNEMSPEKEIDGEPIRLLRRRLKLAGQNVSRSHITPRIAMGYEAFGLMI